jgi:hypothetical protein
MYVIPLTLVNKDDTGPLSNPEYLKRYIETTKSGSFYFHTLNCFEGEFVTMSCLKEDIERAMERCTQELASHSLKPIWGTVRREKQSWVLEQRKIWQEKRALIKDPIRVRG